MSTAVQTQTLAHRLAQYTHQLRFEDLPEAVVAEAKRRIVDSFGCAIGAMSGDPGQIARKVSKTVAPGAGEKGATVLGTKYQAPVDMATFANGTLIRYLDCNDTYLSKEPAHPSDNLAPVLAVGEAVGSSGREMITAMVLAYEVQCRLCDAASIRARGWDHVTYGAFSTALAAGKLWKLPVEQLVHAQAISANPHVAMRQTRVGELSNWKGCAFANSARNGVFSANLARHGLTGPSEIFEGEMGFWNQVSGKFELARFGNESGGDGFMMMRTYIKHFPAEYHSQSAIEAILPLREQLGNPSVEELLATVESITVESFDAAIEIIGSFEEHWKPKHRETADHSMPYLVTAALIDGSITLASFTDQRIQDPKLVELLQRVKMQRSDEMNAGYPDGIPNRVTIRTKDGRTLTDQVTYPLGHYKNPMNDAQVEEKFRALAEPVFPKETLNKLLDALWAFEDVKDLTAVMQLLSQE